jgi:flagellar basal body-associated protein FliL
MRSSVLSLSLLLALCTGAGAATDVPAPAPEHKVTQSESYIMIEPMYATIMDGESPGGMLMVAIGLDIPNPQLRAEVERAMPVLRDAYIRSIIGFTGTHVRVDQQPDVVAIADRLQRVTDRELRRKGANVLLAQVACRVTK